MHSHFILYQAESKMIKDACERLVEDANAMVVFLVDTNGQVLATAGDASDLDTTSLASLTAGNIAATSGMAKLMNEKEFTQIFHEGEKANLHISVLPAEAILLVIFDERSSLGLVRLRVRKSAQEIVNLLQTAKDKAHENQENAMPFAEITDDDIESLFSHS
ncbi:MAG: dynein regulation protein LC7 [Myxococcales bacterium]|nr:dynein regulation protein LC7 [Myxococcales bacterium]|tara:strand:+ start:766 stop:1251 length:486 start_codon:yes stop_codon:yes gene_type:complete